MGSESLGKREWFELEANGEDGGGGGGLRVHAWSIREEKQRMLN